MYTFILYPFRCFTFTFFSLIVFCKINIFNLPLWEIYLHLSGLVRILRQLKGKVLGILASKKFVLYKLTNIPPLTKSSPDTSVIWLDLVDEISHDIISELCTIIIGSFLFSPHQAVISAATSAIARHCQHRPDQVLNFIACINRRCLITRAQRVYSSLLHYKFWDYSILGPLFSFRDALSI